MITLSEQINDMPLDEIANINITVNDKGQKISLSEWTVNAIFNGLTDYERFQGVFCIFP